VKTFANDDAVFDYECTHSRIGMGVVSWRKLKRAPQPGTVEQVH